MASFGSFIYNKWKLERDLARINEVEVLSNDNYAEEEDSSNEP